MDRFCAAVAAVLALVPTNGGAQDIAPRILMPEAPARPSVNVDQLESQTDDQGATPGVDGRTAIIQADPLGPSRSRNVQQTAQVESAAPSTTAVEPLSERSDGKPGPVARISGQDRCDVQNRRQAASDKCRNVIERRAAEFERKAPTLSAEQKLLEHVMAEPVDRGVAANYDTVGANPDSRSSQELAAVVLTRQEPVVEGMARPEENMDAGMANLLEALQAVTGPLSSN